MINVFVGCAPNGEDAESQVVLEYSLRKHCSQPVNIQWMKLGSDPTWTDWETKLWATPFSGFRWSIPEHQQFKGKAIYMDSDMIILSDISELWNQEFEPGKIVMAKGPSEGEAWSSWRYCVCMWDCEAAKEYMPDLAEIKSKPDAHQKLMSYFAGHQGIVQSFKGSWNCIDGEDLSIEDIDNLHYSDMSTQFHLKYAIPRLESAGQRHWFDGTFHDHWRSDLVELFDRYFEEAIAEGYDVQSYIPQKEDMYGAYDKESQVNYDQYRHAWSK